MSGTPKLLPLGSAVTIADSDIPYIIIARGFQKSSAGFLAGYKALPHPDGAAAGVKEIVIKQTQITAVVHRGHETADDAAFAKKQLENAKAPPVQQPAVAEPDLTVDLSRPTSLPPAAPSAVRNPKDPFSELRSKGKRR
ncbi:DUF4176 domain-containing protein [Leifsonia sp. NPDC056665]|uniref:DUF4176 domain-containing protein n=1 Tax=Leifsonia sp. NPDC056665 TaxID=3345901 RepID=UPI0036C99A7B